MRALQSIFARIYLRSKVHCKKGRERTSKFKGMCIHWKMGRGGAEKGYPLCVVPRVMYAVKRCRFNQNISVLAPRSCLNGFPRCLNWLAQKIETRTPNRARALQCCSEEYHCREHLLKAFPTDCSFPHPVRESCMTAAAMSSLLLSSGKMFLLLLLLLSEGYHRQ